jgi:HD-GYP domain-containing protein (c-di-GMP phosphodiesterase class II)
VERVDEGVDRGRIAELTVALSLATDLGTGQPLEHGLRTCLLSLSAASALGLDASTRSTVYHVALLRFIGCTADASAFSALVGDEVAMNALLAPVLNAEAGARSLFFLRRVGDDLSPLGRTGRIARALADPGGEGRSLAAHCEVAARLASRLQMPGATIHALAHAYERFDGKGFPDGLSGQDVPVAIRVVSVARDVELWSRHGWGAAADVLIARCGRAYDPTVVDAFLDGGPSWLDDLDGDLCAQVLAVEPEPELRFGAEGLDRALDAIADFADLRSPSFLGHSSRVARIAGAAASAAGLADDASTTVRRAALVHDIGSVGVPANVWDRTSALGAEQRERIRLHPYLSERVLGRCALLAPFAEVAGRHHERADASGYHRGLRGDQFGVAPRLLAAADVYSAIGEDRPHRPGRSAAEAASALREEVESGRLGRIEVDAVLAASGQLAGPLRRAWPVGLTDREVEVLRLIARGRSNKSVASVLGISAKTVGRHVEHIYGKAEVRTRAGATLFAVEHGLLEAASPDMG